MPLLKLTANVQPSNRQALLAEFSSRCAEWLGKPEGFVMVLFEHNPDVLFGGGSDPLAYIELKSIELPADRTRLLAERLCDLTESQLAVPPNRVYIEFADAARYLWGWNRRTFEK